MEGYIYITEGIAICLHLITSIHQSTEYTDISPITYPELINPFIPYNQGFRESGNSLYNFNPNNHSTNPFNNHQIHYKNQFPKAAQACKAPISATTIPLLFTPRFKYQPELIPTIAVIRAATARLIGSFNRAGFWDQL